MHTRQPQGVAVSGLNTIIEYFNSGYSSIQSARPDYHTPTKGERKEARSMITKQPAVKDQDYKNQPTLHEEVREEETPKMFFIGNLLGCIESHKEYQKEDEDNE
jgi:hypothetical protein